MELTTPHAPRDLEGERILLNEALGGDPHAVRALIRYLEPKLLLRANALLRHRGPGGSRREAMDLVQAAWRDLIADGWQALRRWDPERGVGLLGYVGVVATHRMISELRRAGRARAENPVAGDELDDFASLCDDLEDKVANREYIELVVHELRSELTRQGDQAFEVLYLEGLSIDEAIAKTGLSRDSLYSYRRRIKRMAKTISERLSTRTLDERCVCEGPSPSARWAHAVREKNPCAMTKGDPSPKDSRR